ncbi:hypothetical protein MXB_3222, partial [Myxobolus squamalis]
MYSSISSKEKIHKITMPNGIIIFLENTISNQSCNRMLLRWLKLWDSIVFNKPILSKIDYENNYGIHNLEKTITVILYGNAGSGKSSMARIIGKQCGYQVNEV